MTEGVPQGYVLGPLLFIIYISCLDNTVPHATFHFFADDTIINCAASMPRKALSHLLQHCPEQFKKSKTHFKGRQNQEDKVL